MPLDGLEPLTARPSARAAVARDVSVWIIDREFAEFGTAAAALLSPDEQARAERFQAAGDRARFRSGRAQLRQVLGHCLGTDPASVRFGAAPGGKPVLATRGRADDFRFSASASGALGLVAVCLGADIGVDIERLRDVPGVETLAERLLAAAELADFRQVADGLRGRRFLEYWVRKEAVAKSLGGGLAQGLEQLVIRPWCDAGVTRIEVRTDEGPAAHWVAPVDLREAGHVAAIACAAPIGAVRLRRWTPGVADKSAEERLEPFD